MPELQVLDNSTDDGRTFLSLLVQAEKHRSVETLRPMVIMMGDDRIIVSQGATIELTHTDPAEFSLRPKGVPSDDRRNIQSFQKRRGVVSIATEVRPTAGKKFR